MSSSSVARDAQALVDAEAAVEVRIVDQPLPADGGARLLEVDAHHDLAGRRRAASRSGARRARVLERGRRIVDRARPDDHQQPVVCAVQDAAGCACACRRRAPRPASPGSGRSGSGAPAAAAARCRRCARRRSVGCSGRPGCGAGRCQQCSWRMPFIESRLRRRRASAEPARVLAARGKGASAARGPPKAKTASPCGAGGCGSCRVELNRVPPPAAGEREKEPEGEVAVHRLARPVAFNHAGPGSGKREPLADLGRGCQSPGATFPSHAPPHGRVSCFELRCTAGRRVLLSTRGPG